MKPCRFCGEAESINTESLMRNDNRLWYCICYECEARGSLCDTIEIAIQIWNTEFIPFHRPLEADEVHFPPSKG